MLFIPTYLLLLPFLLNYESEQKFQNGNMYSENSQIHFTVPRFVPVFIDQVERGHWRNINEKTREGISKNLGGNPEWATQYLNPELKNNPLIHKAYLTTAYGNLEESVEGAEEECDRNAVDIPLA